MNIRMHLCTLCGEPVLGLESAMTFCSDMCRSTAHEVVRCLRQTRRHVELETKAADFGATRSGAEPFRLGIERAVELHDLESRIAALEHGLAAAAGQTAGSLLQESDEPVRVA